MARSTLPAALVLSAGLSGGCDWREFDEVLAKAPVLSIGAPEGYSSRDVGRVVVPLTVPSSRAATVSARFLIAGTETPSLAIVDLDSAGRAQTRVASKVEIMDMAGEANAVVKSAVELRDGRILLGTPSYSLNPQQVVRGRIYFLTLVDGPMGTAFQLTRGGDPAGRIGYGLGVAAGRLTGTAEDLVVASQQDVVLLEGGNEAAPVPSAPECALALDDTALEKYRFRALAPGDLIAGGNDEVAVGVPREGTEPGRVVILQRGAGVLTCPVVIDAPMRLPRFGNTVTAADFTGDGKLDLLVGAPPLRAFLFAGPFVAGMAPRMTLELKHPTLPDTSATGDFGFRVFGADLDGKAGLEMLVSAPELPSGGDTGAGIVFAFKSDGTLLNEIADNSPQADASFGFSLASVNFTPRGCGTSRHVLLVGAIREVFTFFRVPGGPPDPRCL
ncbi:MAG TPA: FG-GAP repeat protein [Polyangia bacterium]